MWLRIVGNLSVAGVSDPSPKVQQPILNLLNLAMGELNAR